MKLYLIASFAVLLLASCLVLSNHQAFAVPVSYNQGALTIPWSSSARTTGDIFVPANNGTIIAWYQHTFGTSTITKKLGNGQTTLALGCTTPSLDFLPSNNTAIYFMCNPGGGILPVNHIFTQNGTVKHDFTLAVTPNVSSLTILIGQNRVWAYEHVTAGNPDVLTTKTGGNSSLPGSVNAPRTSNQEIVTFSGTGVRWNLNGTGSVTTGLDYSHSYNFLLTTNNSTKNIDDLAGDGSLPATGIKYWNGLLLNGMNAYSTDSTLPFLTSINANTYKTVLTLPSNILGISETENVNFLLHGNGTDYMVVYASPSPTSSATKIYYTPIADLKLLITGGNYATQSYYTIGTTTTSSFPISLPTLFGYKLYGPTTNATYNTYGEFSLISGYTVKGTTTESAIRTVDPRWTNDNTLYPTITTTGSLFPIALTVTSGPTDAAIKVTNGAVAINGIESVWSIVTLDATHSAQFDLPAGQCANVYVADISLFPPVYLFQGNICATGTSTKSISYTSTIPLTFYSLKYGATDSYVPANNGLQTTVRASTTPFTYNVIVKNSTGTVAINQTFTSSAAIDTRNFNVSSVTKPAGLFISVTGAGQIYSSYLGSPLSFASAASFFHQYFNYQGFDFLSFIPLIFASMFTRNTVGIGATLTVVLIATLSWLSVVVVSDLTIGIMTLVAVLGLVGYRGIYG